MTRRIFITAAILFLLALRMTLEAGLLNIPLPLGLGGRKEDPAELLKTGRAALEDGLYRMAEDNFSRYIRAVGKASPERAQGTILLAQALNGQGRYDDMIELLSPANDAGHAFWLAMAYCGAGQYEKSISEIHRIQSTWSNDVALVRSERLRSRCLLETGHTNEALAVYGQIEARYRDSSESPGNLLDWAKTLVTAGNGVEAREVLGKLVLRGGNAREAQEARQMLGTLLIRDQSWKDAEAVLRPLAEMENALVEYRAGASFLLAEVQGAQQDFAGATNTLSRAIEIAKNENMRKRGGISLGRLLLKIGRLDEGIAVLKPVIAAIPDDLEAGPVQLEIADALLAAGRAEQAEREYQHYLETFKDRRGTARAFSGRGWALWLMREPRYAEAAAAFQQAYGLLVDPAERSQCLIKVADSNFRNGQYMLAAGNYERVIKEFPDSSLVSQARLQVAESYASAGKTVEAVELFSALTGGATAGQFAQQALLRIAELKEAEGDLQAAQAGYEAFIGTYTNSPLYPNALQGHGLVQYRIGRFDRALEDFELMLRIAPQNELAEQAFYMRGWCHQMLGHEEQAISLCEEFVRQFPASRWAPDVIFWLGEQEFNRGACDKAEKRFLELAAKYPKHRLADAALFWAGKSAARRKEYLRANGHFQSLAAKYPKSPRLGEARFAQGDVLCELGQYSTAILIFEEVIRQSDSLLVNLSWGRKGDCEFALGAADSDRYEAAMDSYRVVANSVSASPAVKLQAQYKTGRCLQKMGQIDLAFDQYYKKVILSYLEGRDSGVPRDATVEVWFMQAAFGAVEILEGKKEWNQAINLLTRVVDSGVPGAETARERINVLRQRMLSG